MPIHRVPEDFEPFFESERLSDATVVAWNKVFPVHKVMLSARSSVFSEMFSAIAQPSINAKIEIKDMSDDVIKEILRFIYTGKVNNLHRVADDLLAAASKYKIDELKTISEHSLPKTITTQNVVKRLLLAHNHNAALEKRCCSLYL
ncbi:speckle-type POZ protein B-like [Nasonia vitripennis]|uniref:BTB domain-containing protein n=1 Tax=Nasonia vitripennis TaxID=7425 RepID=A0A7M7H3A3_NASVI|nr:speckle-type POZ protein B-like [Nasonia vitripennis]